MYMGKRDDAPIVGGNTVHSYKADMWLRPCSLRTELAQPCKLSIKAIQVLVDAVFSVLDHRPLGLGLAVYSVQSEMCRRR